MRDRIVHNAHRLESLSITELSRGAEKLVSRERRYTAALIAHLAEISRRRGHLELGYKSLFGDRRRYLPETSGRAHDQAKARALPGELSGTAK